MEKDLRQFIRRMAEQGKTFDQELVVLDEKCQGQPDDETIKGIIEQNGFTVEPGDIDLMRRVGLLETDGETLTVYAPFINPLGVD